MTLPAWITRNRWRGIASRILPFGKRRRLVHWGRWGIAHNGQIGYTEGPERSAWLSHHPPNKLPFATDCSGSVTLWYRMSGLPDPSGLAYKELGYTGTLLNHAQAKGSVRTWPCPVKAGDLIVYGPGTGEHVVMALEDGPDPICVSHGDPAGPNRIKLSLDTRTPKRVCRYFR